jgi:hypothetical protein
MTAALGLSSCSQAGYFCNVQVTILAPSILIIPSLLKVPLVFWITSSNLYFNLTQCVFTIVPSGHCSSVCWISAWYLHKLESISNEHQYS